MARPLTYTPPSATPPAGEEQLADFLAALDESGLLRAATGVVRSYPDVAAVLVRHLDADSLRALLELGNLVRDLDPERAARLSSGARSAITAADHAATRTRAPGLLELVRQARDPDVRRGIGSALAALGAFGRTMRRG